MVSLVFCNIYLEKSKFYKNNSNQLLKKNHILLQFTGIQKIGYTYSVTIHNKATFHASMYI